MTGKERILAALKRQPVDRVPWAPLLVPYTIAGFPKEAPHRVAEAMREVGCDIWTQAIADRYGAWLLKSNSKITPINYFENGDIITGYDTPEGIITERQRSGAHGSMNAPVKHMIETPQDLKAYRYVLANGFLFVADLTDHYKWEEAVVKEDGVITDVGIGLSPFKMFIEFLAGVENTYYLLADEPELFNEVMELMHKQRLKQVKETAKRSIAHIFVSSENTSSSTMSPDLYKNYCAQQLSEYSDILHQYGKLHALHMCGKLSLLSQEIAPGRYDAIIDIAPAPTGDMELWEAVEKFPNKAVKGGIGCDTFIAQDPQACYHKALEVLEKTKGKPGVLLGSGDSVPNGTTMEHLRAVTKAVKEAGTC